MTPKEFFTPLVAVWDDRIKALGIKAGTKKELELQREFMVGAVFAVKAFDERVGYVQLYNYLHLILSSGRNIRDEMNYFNKQIELNKEQK